MVGQRHRLEFGDISVDAVDHGIMSYCHIFVDGRGVHHRHTEEEMAGFGGFSRVLLRGTQLVIALIEERARAAETALAESEER